MWLTSPTAGKLDPKWEGDWEVQAVNGPATYTIGDGKRTKTVHDDVNRLRPRIQPSLRTAPKSKMEKVSQWSPPSVEHVIIDTEKSPVGLRYPTRDRRAPDWFRPP